MHAFHAMAGSWLLMLHGNVFAQHIDEGGDRGDDQELAAGYERELTRDLALQICGGPVGEAGGLRPQRP